MNSLKKHGAIAPEAVAVFLLEILSCLFIN